MTVDWRRTDETGERKAGVEYTVGSVGQSNVLRTTSSLQAHVSL